MRHFSPMLLGSRRKQSKMESPDVTFIFAEDVLEWDAYLARQLEGVTLHRQQVERMAFPLAVSKAHLFSDARVVLVILSPALVRFMDARAADCVQLTRLLRPARTIAMLCGASPDSLAAVKNVLITYDAWRHLEAKDKDINMVRTVIEMIQESLAQSKENERITKPKFKIVPRKVMEGNGKVYVMLSKPLDNSVKVRVTLEANGAKEVPVKKRNPYTLVFVIPDELIHVQNMVNVYVWSGEDLMGISSVKCVSKLGELFSILSSVVSPYEFLSNTLGVGSLSEVDAQLTTVFLKNLPKSGFNMFHSSAKEDRFQTKEELPTLLHFAARYGLFQLAKELLECPGSQTAAAMKNSRSQTPAQMANHEGHNKVAAIIDEFLITYIHDKTDIEKPIPYNQATCLDSEVMKSDPTDDYDIPAKPVPVLHLPKDRKIGNTTNERESDYMKMKGAHKENIEPCQNVFLEEHLDGMKNTTSAEKAKLSLLESQAKLIEIMEAYKKGASLTEVEKLHNEWKSYYQVSDVEAKGTLDGLRNLYAKAQKAKLNKKHSSSFSELRHFLNSKLRRKESIDIKQGNLSRRSSKDSNCSDRTCAEPEAIRPVSTLSVLSNTSSSSGSSFDRLSTASAGSDSGHHSDFCDDRNNKLRERYESRCHQQHRIINGYVNTVNLQRNLQSLNLNSKPPAPPPRPFKPSLHHGSLEDCLSEVPQYSVARKPAKPSFEDTLKMLDYSLPNSKSSTLTNDFRSGRKTSLPFSDFHIPDDPCTDYDRPPPPRPSSSLGKSTCSPFSFLPPSSDPRTDYDLVPPPLPLSAPPQRPNESNYDVPPSVPCDYDFPRATTTTTDHNNGAQPACACQGSSLGSVKSCCVGNKLSSLRPPGLDVVAVRPRNPYCNVFPVSPPREDRDSIPEEMAPPPPGESPEDRYKMAQPSPNEDNPEDHYKMVGEPVPVAAHPTFKVA